MKKGQAAMEFLMTYGWAILVVLIAIGALAYFGVLNPARFLPNSCTLFPGLACTEFQASAGSSSVTLILRNGIGDTIVLDGATPPDLVDVTGCAAPTLDNGNGSVTAAAGGTIGDGGAGTLVWPSGCVVGGSGSRLKSDVTISYTLGSGGLSHTRTGAIVMQVEP